MATPVLELKALTGAGKWAEARIRCSEFCRRTPRDASLWQMAAGIEQQLGNTQQALSYYCRAVELTPDSPGALFEYGMALVRAGNPGQAIPVFHRVVKHEPENIKAYQILGGLYFSQGLFNDAKQCYEQALRSKPEMVEALLGLSNVWNALEHRDAAVSCLLKAISIRPKAHELRYNLGLMLDGMGRLEEAYQICCQTLEINPDYLPAIALQADIHRRQGHYQEALKLLDPLIRRGVKHPRVVDAFVNICHSVGRCDQAVALSQEVCATAGIADQDIMCLHFSTGHALDRLGRYDEAFDHFHKANRLRNTTKDVSELQRLVDDITTCHNTDPGPVHQHRHASTPKLIFIIGMPRSGTTLVEQILASHPDVYGAGELTAMHNVQNSYAGLNGAGKPYPQGINELDENRIGILRQAYLSQLPDASRDYPAVTDKQPGNFLWVGLIRALFPDAAILHCTRNPLDTCLSCYFNNFAGLPYTYDLTVLGKTWRIYQQLMQHWQALSIPMMTSPYEALVNDVEGVSRAFVEYCGLQWNEACLRFHESDRVVSTVSLTQVNQPVYRNSVGRWRHYENHLGPLIGALNGPEYN